MLPIDERFRDPLMRERQPPSRLLRGRRLCKVTLFVPEGCAEGLRQFARFHWSVTVFGQSHPVAAGHTGELARAWALTAVALRAYVADWRKLSEGHSGDS